MTLKTLISKSLPDDWTFFFATSASSDADDEGVLDSAADVKAIAEAAASPESAVELTTVSSVDARKADVWSWSAAFDILTIALLTKSTGARL